MTTMPSLFDRQIPARKRVRRTDPDTSKAAAESLDPATLSEQRRRVLWAISVVEHYGHKRGATACEIVMRLSYTGNAPQQSVVARRCTDLCEFGYIEDSGDRRNGNSNTPLIVWRLTEAGRKATA